MPTINNATVVASAYDTSGNGGRKLVRLSNGWFIAVVSTGTTSYFYKSTNGTTWTQLCWTTIHSRTITLVSKGNTVFYVSKGESSTMVYGSFDATTVSNVDIYGSGITKGLTAITGLNSLGTVGGISMVGEGDFLHLSYHAYHSSYANSSNIFYLKGTINADGSVTWGAVEQVTKFNNANFVPSNPTLILTKNGKPSILVAMQDGSYYNILNLTKEFTTQTSYNSSYVDTSWGNNYVYAPVTYAQSSPSAIFVPQSINGLANGLIGNVWHGRDATHTTTDYIRFSKSLDLGVAWSAMQKLVVGTNPTLTTNKSGKLFITYEDAGVTKRIESTNKGDNWSAPITVGSGTNPSSLFDLTMDMSVPLTIRKGTSSVLFSGTWTVTNIYPSPSSLGVMSDDDRTNFLTYNITTDGVMGTVYEYVNGWEIGSKKLASGESRVVSIPKDKWDKFVNYGKYSLDMVYPTNPHADTWTLLSGQGYVEDENSYTLESPGAVGYITPISQPNLKHILQVSYFGLSQSGEVQIGVSKENNIMTIGDSYKSIVLKTITDLDTTISAPLEISFIPSEHVWFTNDHKYLWVKFKATDANHEETAFFSSTLHSKAIENTFTIQMGSEKWTYAFDKRLASDGDILSAVKATQDAQNIYLPAVKSKLASAVRGKGGTVNDTDSWEQISSAVGGIRVRKDAKGTVTSNASGNKISVRGVAFTPKVIGVKLQSSTVADMWNNVYIPKDLLGGSYDIAVGTNNGGTAGVATVTILTDGFDIVSSTGIANNAVYIWYVSE